MAYDERDEAAAMARGLSRAQLVRMQESLAIPNRAVAQLSPPKLRRLLLKLDHPDRPLARQQFERLVRSGDDGSIREMGLSRGLGQLVEARERSANLARVAGVPSGRRVALRSLAGPMLRPGAGIQPGARWTALGPGNVGGRTRAIVIHPAEPDRIWVGSAGGGVWRSDDGGQSWSPVDDTMANLAVCSMAMDPADPDILYAGTGEGFGNADALRGAGIFVTRDGTQWAQIPATATPEFHFVNRLSVSHDGAVVLAATERGLLRSDDAARASWTLVLGGSSLGFVAFDPTDGAKAIAAGSENGQAYFSTDGGRTWQIATHGAPWPGRVELGYAAADPAIVYASVQATTGQLWRSTDGGRTYQKRQAMEGNTPANFLGEQGWYDNAVWAGDPTDADLLIVGGIDLWRSTDGGDSLAQISLWWQPSSVHADHHAIVSDPGFDGVSNRRVYFGNDGGIYRTDDVRTAGSDENASNGWTSLVNGYAVTQFYGGAGNAQSGTIVGGSQDNGTLSFKPAWGADGWREIFGGDGGYVASDPSDSQVFYGEYVYLGLHRSTDGAESDADFAERYINGEFWNENKFPVAGWDWKPVPLQIPDSRNRRALFIAPFVLDPNDSDRILAGGMELWRTNDAKTPNSPSTGPSWASIKPSIGSQISAITVAAGDSDLVFVGHAKGELFRARNGQSTHPTWERLDHAAVAPLTPRRLCTRIVVRPDDHDVVYVTFGGYEADNVWRSSDGGAIWMSIAASIPDVPVRSLALHPDRPDFVYLGTEVGLFSSEDGGTVWSPTNEGPTNCSVNELFWMDRVLVCVTHGRGMFSIDLGNL